MILQHEGKTWLVEPKVEGNEIRLEIVDPENASNDNKLYADGICSNTRNSRVVEYHDSGEEQNRAFGHRFRQFWQKMFKREVA